MCSEPLDQRGEVVADDPCVVKFHIRNIFGKLGVSSRPEAVARGRELALL